MTKVTRIAYSKHLNKGKYTRLEEIAGRLASIRAEVWRRYGSISGLRRTHMAVRDEWLAEGRTFDLPARMWKASLQDVIGDIGAYREAAKVEVRKAIHKRTDDEQEQIRLFTWLKYDRWLEDDYLRRMMRKYFKHGKTSVDNQIVLDTQCYRTFSRDGQGWIAVMSLERGHRIAIPLNSTEGPTGTIRLLLRDGRVEIHYAVDEKQVCSTRPSGTAAIGIDKGYTETFTDSDGDVHGEGLGELLSQESDYLKTKYKRRNKIRAVAKNKPHKRAKIKQNNLGRKKLNRRKKKHNQRIRDKVYKAAHTVVDKAKTIAAEDLTAPMRGKSYGKNQNRRLAGWVKGIMAEAIESVSPRRGSTVILVNPAYTSQMDSRYGILLGERRGDLFYCFDGVVLPADQNAARNILVRLADTEIHLYMPYQKVKEILVKRTEQQKRMGLLIQDSSCSGNQTLFGTQFVLPPSTESEKPFLHNSA